MFEIILLIFLLALSAFFSSAETAFMSIPEHRVKMLIKDKIPRAKTIKRLVSDKKKLIITILIGNNLVNIASSAIATKLALDYFGNLGLSLATGLMTFLILTFGEIIPKTYATINYTKVALFYAYPMYIIDLLLYPIVEFFYIFSNLVFKIFRRNDSKNELDEDEIVALLRLGSEKRVIDKDEREYMENILELDDIKVSEIATKKDKMFILDGNMKIKDAIESLSKKPYSRIPIVINDRIDSYVHIRDLLMSPDKELKLLNISRDILVVNSNDIVNDVFDDMKYSGVHIALVKNNGEIFGLITFEDIIEEIFGEIHDESDITPLRHFKINKNIYLVHGSTKISDINKHFKIAGFNKYSDIKLKQFLADRIDINVQDELVIYGLKFKIESRVRGEPRLIKVIRTKSN